MMKAVPQGKIRCWERAAKGSFFSRENACNFLHFCRHLGIHENLLFESEDLGNSIELFHSFHRLAFVLCVASNASRIHMPQSSSGAVLGRVFYRTVQMLTLHGIFVFCIDYRQLCIVFIGFYFKWKEIWDSVQFGSSSGAGVNHYCPKAAITQIINSCYFENYGIRWASHEGTVNEHQ